MIACLLQKFTLNNLDLRVFNSRSEVQCENVVELLDMRRENAKWVNGGGVGVVYPLSILLEDLMLVVKKMVIEQVGQVLQAAIEIALIF